MPRRAQFADTPTGNFEALWSALDRHYCFFQYKNVDWQEVHDRYAAKISNSMTSEELFRVCSEMLKELKDGHTNLSSSFDTSRYWIWEQFPQNYDERLVEEHYLHFDYRRTSGISYRILDNNYAYMRYPSFSYSIGEGNLDNVLATLALADGLIIDVRDNGGGIITNAETIVARFIDKRILAGYISHKTGSGHDDFFRAIRLLHRPGKRQGALDRKADSRAYKPFNLQRRKQFRVDNEESAQRGCGGRCHRWRMRNAVHVGTA